jgi:hypothetical protein
MPESFPSFDIRLWRTAAISDVTGQATLTKIGRVCYLLAMEEGSGLLREKPILPRLWGGIK